MKTNDAVIREQLGTDLNDLLRRFVDSNVKKENDLQFYSGIVVDNNDPDKEGKCKIRVYGVFEDTIPNDDLPWAIPDFAFIGSTLGSFVVPPNNTIVKVYFDGGEIYTPRYTTKVFNTASIAGFTAGIDEDYPNSMVMFETDTGEYFKINRATNETTYRHSSGVIISIDDSGNINIDQTPSDSGDVTWDVKGDFNLTVGGALSTKSTTTTTIEATTDLTVKGLKTVVQGSTYISLKHPQGPFFVPNTLPTDPASTAPHGAVLGGLTTLKSEFPS